MDAALLAEFRKLLVAERDRIFRNTRTLVEQELALSGDDLADENDLASALYDQGFNLRMRDRERMLLVKIEAALRRMDEGDFGYCVVCDDDIDPRRLRARPVTTMCIECKEDSERTEGQYAPVVSLRDRRSFYAPEPEDTFGVNNNNSDDGEPYVDGDFDGFDDELDETVG